MCRNVLVSALGNFTDYLAYIIVALMIIIFIIIVVFAVKKRKKTVGYTSDEIDRSVDEAAKKKAAERAEVEEVKEEQPAVIDETKEHKKETAKVEKSVEKKTDEPKTEQPKAEKIQKANTEKPADKEITKEKAKTEKPKAEKPKTEPKTIAEPDEEDTGEELTFEAADIDEQPEHKEAPKRKISYRILYDKETKTWEVRKDQAKRVIRRVKTKKEALEIAQELCEKQELNLVVHKKDGKFQKQR